ncbi:MAG TPA: cyclic nucleotide-binding domain-containing protein [Anaerolineales bacterium]|jgi:CRP/FNR family transcriptional regulator|nr:cyclic nucleotide-binding domain-containing protein [Anaerolineales bacterium]
MKQIAILEGLDAEDLELLQPLFEKFSCLAGRVIFQQDTPADFLYFLINGKVEMSFQPYGEGAITISQVSQDGLFGWSAVVGSEKYTSSAIAHEDVEAFRIRGSELRKFCREHPKAGQDILDRLANGVSLRRRDAHKQVQSILLQGMTEKREEF